MTVKQGVCVCVCVCVCVLFTHTAISCSQWMTDGVSR